MQDSNGTQSVPTELASQSQTQIFHHRLVIGLVQGAALYLLLRSTTTNTWPATSPIVFAILVSLSLFLPPLLIVGSGHIVVGRIWRWVVPIGIVLSGVSSYAEWRWDGVEVAARSGLSSHHFYETLFYLVPIVFIVWSLIQSGEHDKNWRADYRTYFDMSWKFAVQLKFASAFVCAFWLVLWLGAGLFMLLKLDFLMRLITHNWFWMPATTLMVACGLHLTDVRPGIVNGIRNLLLSMLSWLLPLLAFLVGTFLVSIPFAGFELLWKTRFASGLLLGTCAVLIVLINTCYQGGDRVAETHPLMRHAVSLACVLLLPLATIAGYALGLRVAQYGWTPDRILAAACVLQAAFYACGYLWALLEPSARRMGLWLPHIATTNVYAAWMIIALVLSLLTPLVDPARLSVASQVGRLLEGKTTADQFDYKFLRFEGVRYGKAALDELTRSSEKTIREKAVAALAMKNSWQAPEVTKASITDQVTLKVPGQNMPAGFLEADWNKQERNWEVPNCLKTVGNHCDAFVGDFSGHGRTEVLLIPEKYGNAVLAANNDGWKILATFEFKRNCQPVLDGLAKGDYRRVPPMIDDIMVGESRLRAIPVMPNSTRAACASQ